MVTDFQKSEFKVDGFSTKSIPWLLLILISVLLSYWGIVLLLQFLALLFVIFPSLYKKLHLKKLSLSFLRIPQTIFIILSLIPTVNFKGNWFMEDYSQTKEIKNVKSLTKFFYYKKIDYLIIYPGIISLSYRIIFNIEEHVYGSIEETGYLVGLSFGGFFSAFLLIPLLFMCYFLIVWILEDVGIKIVKVNQNPRRNGSERGDTNETDELSSLSSSIRNLIGLFAGISTISWIAEQMNITGSGSSVELIGSIAVIFAFLVMYSGPGLLMGVMYYRSGVHEEFVNDVRKFILEKNKEEERRPYRIKIGTYVFSSPSEHGSL